MSPDWVELDNSDGEASAFFEDLRTVWTEVVLTADLTTRERQTWAKKLAMWQYAVDDCGVDEAFEAAMAAAEQGWEYLPLLRVLRGEITDQGAWEDEAPSCADALVIARLNVLERQGRSQEYLKVQELAGERWPEIRTELLAHLRQGRLYAQKGAVEIFLHEGLVKDAMRTVEKGESYSSLEQVVDAATPSHADWAIQVCRQQAEPIMQQGQSQHYHHAARWLEKARAAYRTAGRETEWQAYLAELMTRYRCTYSLMPRLEAL